MGVIPVEAEGDARGVEGFEAHGGAAASVGPHHAHLGGIAVGSALGEDEADPGGSVTAEIQQQNVSALTHYAPAGWTCKAAGVPVTPTIVDVPNTPWDSIRLNIAANAAVSCIQNVTYIP